MTKIFEVKTDGLSAQIASALEQVSTHAGIVELFQAANSFDLLEHIIMNRIPLAKAIQENAKTAKYNEILANPATKTVAEMTGQTAEQIARMGAEKFLDSIGMPSFLKAQPVAAAAATSSKRTSNPRNPIVKAVIDGVEFTHSGGGQVKEEIADYFFDKVKDIKDLAQRKAKLKEAIYAHKVEGAEEFKLNNMVDSVLETCTIRFALKDEKGQIRLGGKKNLPLSYNGRGRMYDGFVQSLAEEVKKGKKVADFYIKNDIDDEANKAALIARVEGAVKELIG